MSSIGWITLSDILDLYKEKNNLEWLTTKIIITMLTDKNNKTECLKRSLETQSLMRMLWKREQNL